MSKKIRRIDGILTSQLDDTLLMLNIPTGRYHGLNPVATRIWALLEQPVTQAELVTTLVTEFQVTGAECAAQVDDFLNQLRQRGLLADDA